MVYPPPPAPPCPVIAACSSAGRLRAAVSIVVSVFLWRSVFLNPITCREIRYVPVKHMDTGRFELILVSELDQMKKAGLVVNRGGTEYFTDVK